MKQAGVGSANQVSEKGEQPYGKEDLIEVTKEFLHQTESRKSKEHHINRNRYQTPIP